jgi:hypothetical protein
MAMDMSSINNAISRMQMQNAQSVTQANLGSLKTQKEIANEAVEEEPEPELNDEVQLSAAAQPTEEQQMAAAENSGDLSQVDPQLKNRDQDKIENARQQALHLAEEERQQDLQGAQQMGEDPDPMAIDVASADGLRRMTDQELIEQLLGDLPGDIKKVSGEMVTNQIKGTQPASSLNRLHNIPEPALKELSGEPFLAEPLGIHDTANLPLPFLEEAPV